MGRARPIPKGGYQLRQSFTARLSLAFITTSLLAIASPAFAQEAQGADEADGGEIIVTARRRDETLQSTPVAITAIGTAQIESKGAVNMGDLQGAAPNLLITQQNSGAAAANLSIRGLTFADIEKSFDPTVGVVVDGVFMGTSTGQFFDFFDISQIEVLRGPQGTLFGRNTIGGVINIRRSKPTGELGGKIEASYGSFKSKAIRTLFNVPIIKDGLAAKVWYFHNDTDGFLRQGAGTIGAGKRRGFANNDNFGVSFLATPGDNFEALLTVEKQIQDYDTANSNICEFNATTGVGEAFCAAQPAREQNRNRTNDLYTVFGQPASGHFTTPAVTLELNADVGGVKLTSVSAYRRSTEDQTQDFDSSSVDEYFTRRQQTFRQYSQELRAAGDFGDTFDYVVGAYFYDGRYRLRQDTAVFGNDIGGPQIVSGTAKSLAFFGDFNVTLAEKFRVNVGGRYTHDKKSIDNFFFGNLGNPSKSFSKFTPKVSVDYRPNNNHLVYASWSRGFRSGGFSNRAQTVISTNAPYGIETVDSYEVGLKSAFLDRKLQFNLAAFYSDYKGLQQNTTIAGGPTGNETIVTNVGSSAVKGIELDFTAKPVRGLTFAGTLGLLRNKFKGFISNAPSAIAGQFDRYDYSAVNPIYSPKANASFNATYDVPTDFGRVVATVGYRYIAPYDQQISIGANTFTTNANGTRNYTILANDPRVRSDRQGLIDASLSVHFDLNGAKAKATVYGRNLANDKGTSAAFTVADNPAGTGLWSFASAREPRAYGASLGFEF
jgi:iron complex outermembrane recepter protein